MSIEKVKKINVPGWGTVSVLITWAHSGGLYLQLPETGSCKTVSIRSAATADLKKAAAKLLSNLAKEA